jgi:hypothetical protein
MVRQIETAGNIKTPNYQALMQKIPHVVEVWGGFAGAKSW